MTKTITCSYCGASDTILCKQPHGYSSVTLADKKMAFMAFNGQTLYHEICKNCGTVVRSFINEPEKLQKRQKSLEQKFWGFSTLSSNSTAPVGLAITKGFKVPSSHLRSNCINISKLYGPFKGLIVLFLGNAALTCVRTASMPLSSAAPDGLAITKGHRKPHQLGLVGSNVKLSDLNCYFWERDRIKLRFQ